MENTELIKLLDNEIERVALVLRATRPESNDYCNVLDNMRNLFWFQDAVKHPRTEVALTTCSPEVVKTDEPKTVTESVPFIEEPAATFHYTEPEPVGESEPPVVVSETVEISYEDLRAAVKEKAASGKPMQPVIEKYVPDGKPVKLSSVPKARYAELMKELNNAG